MSMHDPHGETRVEAETPTAVIVAPPPPPTTTPAPGVPARSAARGPLVRRKPQAAPAPSTSTIDQRMALAEEQIGPARSRAWYDKQLTRDLQRQLIEATKKSGTPVTTAPPPSPPQSVTFTLGEREVGLIKELIDALRRTPQAQPAPPTPPDPPPPVAEDPEVDEDEVEVDVEVSDALTDEQYRAVVTLHRLSQPLMVNPPPLTRDEASRVSKLILNQFVADGLILQALRKELDDLLDAGGAVTAAHEALWKAFEPDFFRTESASDPVLLYDELRRRAAWLVEIVEAIAGVFEEEVIAEDTP